MRVRHGVLIHEHHPAEILAADSGIGYLLQKVVDVVADQPHLPALLTICILGFV